ncbi:MAG: helix-turn-helix transcriptional regulator [Planctomycetota bacterium]
MSAHPAHVRRGHRGALGLAILMAAIVLFATADLVADLATGTTWLHVLLEAGTAAAGMAGLWVVLRRLAEVRHAEREARGDARALADRLAASQLESERWRREAHDLLAGLGAAIDRQFVRWALTPAECEIARLVLKGLSHKDIAAVRAVSEATVRQQAGAVYKKAGLEGRHDLAAFFLEGLLLPPVGAADSESP